MAGDVHKAENVFIYKNNCRVHIRMYRMYNGSAPVRTLNVSLSFVRARLWVCLRERDIEGAWVCVFPPVT